MKKFDANSNNPLDDQGQDLSAEQVKFLRDHEDEFKNTDNGIISAAMILDDESVVKELVSDFKEITRSSLFKKFLFIWLITIAFYSLLHFNPALYHEYADIPEKKSTNKNIESGSPPKITDENREHAAGNTSSYPRTRKETNEYDYFNSSNKLNTSHVTGIDSFTSGRLTDTFTLPENKEENNSYSRINSFIEQLKNNDFTDQKTEGTITAFDFKIKSNTHWDPFKTSNLITNTDSTSLNQINSNSIYLNKVSSSITTIKSWKGTDIALMTSYISDYLKTNMEIKKDMVVVIIMTDASESTSINFNPKNTMANNSNNIIYEPRIEKFKLGELLYRIGQSDSWKSCTSNQLKFVADKDGIIELMVNLKSNRELLKKSFFVSISSSILSECR